MRQTFLGGFAGQLVSAALWLVSAALATWGTPRQAIVTLVAGGFFIFPLATLFLKLAGRRATLGPGHPMNALAMQVAFTLPLTLPLVAAVASHHLEWFYPAFMIALGAHYLPFVFLYGMRMHAVLCAVLVGGGLMLGLHGPPVFAAGGWATGLVLIIAAFAGRAVAAREADAVATPPGAGRT